MKNIKTFLLFLVIPLLVSCASAPWHETPSASTVGEKKASLSAGYHSLSITGFKFTYGATDRIDVGAQLEVGPLFSSMGLHGRYGLILPDSERQGWALSTDLGTGYSGSDSKYIFGGLAGSYRWRWIEPHIVARGNYVWNKERYSFSVNNVSTTIEGDDYGYVFSVAGLTFWPAKSFALYIQSTFFNENYSGLQIGLYFRSP
jgi:hypothetical protein